MIFLPRGDAKDIILPGQEFQLYWLSSWLPELYCTTQTMRELYCTFVKNSMWLHRRKFMVDVNVNDQLKQEELFKK